MTEFFRNIGPSQLWLELLREECGSDPKLTIPLEKEAGVPSFATPQQALRSFERSDTNITLIAIMTTMVRRSKTS